MLKQLWDYMFLVRTCIDDWRTTMWVDIDVENMDMECKKFAKVTISLILQYLVAYQNCVKIELVLYDEYSMIVMV